MTTTPCTCHPGKTCAIASQCEIARKVEFGDAALRPAAQEAVCNNGDCSWGGPLADCRMLGSIGPLCPVCGETVEPCGSPQQATPEPVGYLYDFTVDGKTCTDWYTSAAEWSGVAKDGVSNVRPLVYGYTRPAPAEQAVPEGWKLSVSGSAGRKWLHIESPGGAKAAFSTAATIDGGRHATIAAQVLDAFAAALATKRTRPAPAQAVPTTDEHRTIRDANRYLWWVNKMFSAPSEVARVLALCESPDDVDAAIDRAMDGIAAQAKEGG